MGEGGLFLCPCAFLRVFWNGNWNHAYHNILLSLCLFFSNWNHNNIIISFITLFLFGFGFGFGFLSSVFTILDHNKPWMNPSNHDVSIYAHPHIHTHTQIDGRTDTHNKHTKMLDLCWSRPIVLVWAQPSMKIKLPIDLVVWHCPTIGRSN